MIKIPHSQLHNESYLWYKETFPYKDLIKTINDTNNIAEIKILKKFIILTQLGKDFLKVCLEDNYL